jgi:predicted N-acyltransferase
MPRAGCQFHWHNRAYGNFDDFMSTLVARKRKNIRRERQRVRDAGVMLEVRHGGDVSPAEWQTWQRLYESTFERKSGIPTLSLDFFREIGRTMADQVVVVFARRRGDIIAGAFCVRGEHTLYGRHWGAFESHDSLHFETCYYQGIEFCIREGLACFEPGAQGEHKIARGFLPAPTWSAHWIGHEGFREAIARFLDQERVAVADYMAQLSAQSPYRAD